jgi:hypothetical protein
METAAGELIAVTPRVGKRIDGVSTLRLQVEVFRS